MSSIYADKLDIRKRTSATKKELQVQRLAELSIPFDIADNGDILVLRASLEENIRNKKPPPELRRHNFAI